MRRGKHQLSVATVAYVVPFGELKALESLGSSADVEVHKIELQT